MNKNTSINKILICSVGSIGRKYISSLKLNWPNIEIGALRSGHGKKFQELDLLDFNFFSKEEAIKWRPDAAIICNPAPFHLDLSLIFGREKIPLLIEKPIGTGKEPKGSWRELKDISKRTPILVGYQLRFDPCCEYIKNILSSRKLGKVVEADFYCGSWLPDWRKSIDYTQSVSSKENLGGGVLLELSHEIDLANYIFGNMKVIGSSASNSGILNIDTSDNAAIILRNDRGILITIRINFCSRPDKRFLIIRTNEAEIKWDLLGQFVEINHKEKLKKTLGLNDNQLMIRQLKNFFECINTNTNPICGIEDGLKVLDIVKQVDRI